MHSARRLTLLLASALLLVFSSLLLDRLGWHISNPVLLILLISAGIVAGVAFFNEVRSWQLPPPEDPPTHRDMPTVRPSLNDDVSPRESIVQRTLRKMDEAEQHASKLNGKLKIRISSDEDAPPPSDDDAPPPKKPKRPDGGRER